MEAHPVLTPEREYVLGLLANAGDVNARNRLVLCNQRALIKMANAYVAKHPGIEAEDIIAEGNIGLLNAASTFDPRGGVRFLSYARKFVLRSIVRYLFEDAGLIRYPQHQAEKMHRIRAAIAEGARTPAEIADASKICVEDVKMLMGYLMPVISLDTPVGEGDDSCVFGDLILTTDKAYEYSIEQLALRDILAKISPKSRDLLIRHYGVFGRRPESLASIARRLHVSREYMRRMKDKALRECRRSA